jgi:hypothetical protein
VRCGNGITAWQRYDESSAAFVFPIQIDFPAQQLRKPLGDIKPQLHIAVSAGGGVVDLEKFFKNCRPIFSSSRPAIASMSSVEPVALPIS